MVWELILAILCGVSAGTITGLIPGLHTNLVTSLLIISYPTLGLPLEPGIVFVTALALTHLMIDYIPSILLGAPDEDSFLATLP
jgi:putative membrane protein